VISIFENHNRWCPKLLILHYSDKLLVDGKCNQTSPGGSCGGTPLETCYNDPADCGPCPTIANISDANIATGACNPLMCSAGVCSPTACGNTLACQYNCGSAHYGGTGGFTIQSDAVDFLVDNTTCPGMAALSDNLCGVGGTNYISYQQDVAGTLHVSINTRVGEFLADPDSSGVAGNACPSPNGGPPIPGPPPPPLGTGPANSSVSPQASVNEPISTGNGNYYYQHTDFVIPGRGMPLVLQRSYNTLDNYAGPLGTNWTHSYNVILTGTSDGTINVRWGDGHGETFTPNGSGYITQPGVFSTLVRNADSTFILTQKNRTRYSFSSAGRLTSILDRNGNAIQLTYNGGGNLTQIVDTVGRTVTLTYDASNRITQITDPAGRTVSFQYSSANDLIATTDPAGGITHFAYDANHHVTSIIASTSQKEHMLKVPSSPGSPSIRGCGG
jgi:YD repeat-containing protein